MNISELFEKIQDCFMPEDLNGEITLHGNCITWSYTPDNENIDEQKFLDEDSDALFGFESTSSEELLQEVYKNDLMLLEELFDDLEEIDNWSFSEPDIVENNISFKIF